MVKLKKYSAGLKYFVLFLTFATLSCKTAHRQLTRIEGREIPVEASYGTSAAVEQLIKPYREKVESDMNTVLAYAPETLDKTGLWQTPMGNMFADVALVYGNRIFKKRENRSIDIVLLNHGGIRSIIPKGNITTRTAFEIMPFENSMVVCTMSAATVREMVNYIIVEKKPHPLSGLTFTIDQNGLAQNIMIQGNAIQDGKTYYVGTNDYLYNGGDNMTFFKNSGVKYDLDYKLRNILIDYFTDVDTVSPQNDVRIKVER